jgi:hypothetical protein
MRREEVFMATQPAVDPKVTEQPEPKAKKPRRTFSFGLRAMDGAGLRITLKLKKDGTATTWATHKPKGGKGVRGATEQHATQEKAKAAMEKLVERALAKGWERKVRTGFAAKPDAFDAANLPAPVKGKK